ncbi:MAG: universal stress protein [Cyanobacteriota bacterium]|nr:universal stress protein [Cyanobacteriota bacterium]
MFQRILICTDFKDGMQRLVRFVPSLAKSGLRQIVFCHVAPPLDDREICKVDEEAMAKARERLSVALENVPDGVEVEIDVDSGKFADIILKIVKKHDSDLILLGTQPRTLLNQKLFGSNTIELTQRSSVPLMAIRPSMISTYTNEELELRCAHLFRSLLVPYDGTDEDNGLLKQIERYSEKIGDTCFEECLLGQVLDVAGQRREVRQENAEEEARKQLEPIKTQLEEMGLKAGIDVRSGDPLAGILDMALEYNISAIAIAARSVPNRLIDWSRPSFSSQILRSSWHPVIFVPAEK